MSTKALPTINIDVSGNNVDIAFRKNPRAKRYTLRLDRVGKPVVTVPRYGTVDEALTFLTRHKEWLQERLENFGGQVMIEPGATIPLRGEDTLLCRADKSRGLASLISDNEQQILYMPGSEQHFARRVIDWLKKEVRKDLEEACRHHANNLGVKVRSISIRDQKTRWGSCSHDGALNFSWRLIFAPSDVLDYVAAHEVAHILEMNHQPQFWALVKQTCPQMDYHRMWLKQNGASLHRFTGP